MPVSQDEFNDSTIRRLLGTELRFLRERAGLKAFQVAAKLRNTDATVRRWERGGESVCRYSELTRLFDLYGVGDQWQRQLMTELHEQSPGRLWYSRLRIPEVMARMCGFEVFARTVDWFEQSVVPAVLQTEDYAQAALAALDPGLSAEDVKRLVELRIERQRRIYAGDRSPAVRVVVTERALRTPFGSAEVMHSQLRRLYSGPNTSHLRVLPEDVQVHEGLGGAFCLYTFAQEDRAPVIYAEHLLSSLYTADDELVARARTAFDRLWAAALPELDSSKLILSLLKAT